MINHHNHNNKRTNIVKLLMTSIVMLLVGVVLAGNNKAYATNVPYSIIYDDSVTFNMPTDVDDTSMMEQVTMANNTPTRPGFKYLGWCNVVPTSSGGTDLCTGGTTYQPSASLTLDQTGTNNFHFYAMWEKEPNTIANSTYLQEVEACPASLTTGQVYTVKDSRDNQEYKVAKLADGKCWMVENLNLAGGTALDADKTDVTSAYISSFTTSDGLTKNGNTIVLPASSTSGFLYANYSYIYNSGNKTNCGASGQNTPCYSYYSWDAATLGSGRTFGEDSADAEQSICPKGWKLPTARMTNEADWRSADFYAMAHQYGLDSTTSTYESDADFYNQAGPGTTPNFLLAGFYYNGSFYDGGTEGVYWSSRARYTSADVLVLDFYSSHVASDSDFDGGYGCSVRCLFSGQ